MSARTVRRSAREGGFTLVELMLSIVVLSIGLLGLASAMASMTRYQELSTARSEMALLADAKFERMRQAAAGRTADTLELAVGGSLTMSLALHADTVQGRGTRLYIRRWEVAALAGPGGTRDVTLRISPLVDEPRTPARLDFKTLILINN